MWMQHYQNCLKYVKASNKCKIIIVLEKIKAKAWPTLPLYFKAIFCGMINSTEDRAAVMGAHGPHGALPKNSLKMIHVLGDNLTRSLYIWTAADSNLQ